MKAMTELHRPGKELPLEKAGGAIPPPVESRLAKDPVGWEGCAQQGAPAPHRLQAQQEAATLCQEGTNLPNPPASE